MESKLSDGWTREKVAKRAENYAKSSELWRDIATLCGHPEPYTSIEADVLAKLAWAHVNRLLLSELREKMRVI